MNFMINVYSEPREKPSNNKLLDAHWLPRLGTTLVQPTLGKLARSAMNKPWHYIWVSLQLVQLLRFKIGTPLNVGKQHHHLS